MSSHAILTAIGPDRPGLVDEVSQFIFERGGNIEDSRMVNLRGRFAIIMLIGAGPTALHAIEREAAMLSPKTGLRVEVNPAGPVDPVAASAADARPYRLTATAMDQAGLVHRVANLLRRAGVNIESFDTHLAAAPYTGAPVFEMDLTIAVPRKCNVPELRQQLATLCGELNIDWELTAL